MRKFIATALLLFIPAVTVAAPRVVALGGDITETVYALGAGSELVAVDATSTYPAQASSLPNVGYVRQLGAEGVLATRPTLVLATHDAGPPPVIAQLQAAHVDLEQFPATRTPADIVDKVRRIGDLLDRGAAANALANEITAQFTALGDLVERMPRHPRVVFLMSAGDGSPMAAGRDTAAARAMTLSGAVNAVDGYDGYKPISAEALVALAPDAIVMMRERSDGSVDGVLKVPGAAQTPAGKGRHVLFVDGQALLGFGPRTAKAAKDLQAQLAALGT